MDEGSSDEVHRCFAEDPASRRNPGGQAGKSSDAPDGDDDEKQAKRV